MASSDMSAHEMPIEELLARLDHRPPGTTPAYLAKLDIGIFPSTLYTKEDLRQLNAVDHTFHFLRWIHRNNGSDVALIKWKDQPGLHVLKIVSVAGTSHAIRTNVLFLAQKRKKIRL